VHDHAADLQPAGIRTGCRSPQGARPIQERPASGVAHHSHHELGLAPARPVSVITRVARLPRSAPDVDGTTHRRAGALPPRVRQAARAADRQRRDGAELALIRSYSMQW
jgi:hypothetical protein